jgi:large subunit ribosomal protein L6
MSRVAKKIITMPKGVELKDADGVLSVKGPKGTLTMAKPAGVSVSNENGQVQLGAAIRTT